jgi:hypothetical protein
MLPFCTRDVCAWLMSNRRHCDLQEEEERNKVRKQLEAQWQRVLCRARASSRLAQRHEVYFVVAR